MLRFIQSYLSLLFGGLKLAAILGMTWAIPAGLIALGKTASGAVLFAIIEGVVQWSVLGAGCYAIWRHCQTPYTPTPRPRSLRRRR